MYTNEIGNRCNLTVFATGSRCNDLTRNWILTPKLNLINNKNVFAGGDCIVPKNAQVAYQQGKYVAEILNGEHNNDFVFNNKGISVYVGNNICYTEPYGFIPSFIVKFYYKYLYR
jgi:NADH dehydrogenase FAD-containing subunit